MKQAGEKEIVVFGSPGAAHSLTAENLIEEIWLFVNPVLVGQGIPLFKNIQHKRAIKLVVSHTFSSGVVCLHHQLE